MTKREDCFCYVLLVEDGESRMTPVYVVSQVEARVITVKGKGKTIDPSRLGAYSSDAKGDWQRGAVNFLRSLNAQMQELLSEKFSAEVVSSMLEINQRASNLLLMLRDLF